MKIRRSENPQNSNQQFKVNLPQKHFKLNYALQQPANHNDYLKLVHFETKKFQNTQKILLEKLIQIEKLQ